jgi:hypothetical protein
VDAKHHRIWGVVVAFLYLLGYIPFLILMGLAQSSNLLISFLGTAGSATYVLGFVGGIWGIFSGTHLTPRIRKGILGPAGHVFLGGLVSFIATAIFGASIFLLAPFALVLGAPLLVYLDPRRGRIIAVILLVASLATVLPIAVILLSLMIGGRLANNYSNIPSFVAILLGGLLAGSRSMNLIRRRQTEVWNLNLKQA